MSAEAILSANLLLDFSENFSANESESMMSEKDIQEKTADETTDYLVLVYYKYVKISDPVALAKEHLAFCKSLGARGRIIISQEGVNGTLSAPREAAEAYMLAMQGHPLFCDMSFKSDSVEGHVFRKLFVRAKAELVTFRVDRELDPNERTGQKLKPIEFYELAKRDDVLIVDARSDYEYDLGHFRGAIRPSVRTFRDFPNWIRDTLSEHKEKKIITYCTGGIRCEKFTAYLLAEGFQDVGQLEGGILTYGKDPEVQGKLFDGKCYVFDERIGVPINQVEEAVVSRCVHCGVPCDHYINCAYDDCHVQHFSCEVCGVRMEGACSEACKNLERALQLLKRTAPAEMMV
jgi:UPF0176 protein